MIQLKIQFRYRTVDNIPSTEIYRNINEYQPVFNGEILHSRAATQGKSGCENNVVLVSQFH